MGEKVVVVCDVCGQQPAQTIGIRVGRRSLQKDLCNRHLAELTAGARRPRPGRRRGSVSTPSGTGNGRRRRGRPRKGATTEASGGGESGA